MALDYAKCAKEIFETVGGRENLVSAAHCATRLRLVTVDNGRIDMKNWRMWTASRGYLTATDSFSLSSEPGRSTKSTMNF